MNKYKPFSLCDRTKVDVAITLAMGRRVLRGGIPDEIQCSRSKRSSSEDAGAAITVTPVMFNSSSSSSSSPLKIMLSAKSFIRKEKRISNNTKDNHRFILYSQIFIFIDEKIILEVFIIISIDKIFNLQRLRFT